MLKEAWTLAIETLSWIEMQRLTERSALVRTIKQVGINDSNAIKYAYRLVYETIRRRNFIDRFINKTLRHSSLSEFTFGIQAFLRIYVYKTRIAKNWSKPDVNEAENVSKLVRGILGWKTIRKVEHVLGSLLTQEPTSPIEGVSDEQLVGLLTFHPTWFVRYCFKLFGRIRALAILKGDMQTPPTHVRINTLKASIDEGLGRLRKSGIEIEKVEGLKYSYTVIRGEHLLTRTKTFRKGFFCVQDKASCLAVDVANPKPGAIVLDVCAAPGTKTTYLAQLMQNKGLIYSIDHSRSRMNLWKNEVSRMNVKIATPVIADARRALPLQVKADVIILDPPCTSTGVFGRLPSAKWRITRNSIDAMAKIQWEMIDSCADHVKSGGSLLYCTCSLTVEENEKIIERFLKLHPDFSSAETSMKVGLRGLRGSEECRRLYPNVHQCNGFFIAKLLKK